MDQNANLAALRDSPGEQATSRRPALHASVDWRTLGPTLAIAVGSLALATWFAVPLLEPVTPVRVATVTARDEAASTATKSAFNASGWVEPDPYYQAIVTRVSGVIEAIPVVEGDALVKGETIIAQLDTTRIDRTVAERAAAIKLAEQMLALATAQHDAAALELAQNADARTRLADLRTALARSVAMIDGKKTVVATLQRARELNVDAQLAAATWAVEKDELNVELDTLQRETPALESHVEAAEARAAALRELADTSEARLLALAAEAELETARWSVEANAMAIASVGARLNVAQVAYDAAVDGAGFPAELEITLAQATTELDALLADHAGLEAELALAEEIANAPASLIAARDIASATVGLRQAELEAAREAHRTALVEQRLHTLQSPIDGRVLEVRARPGMAVGEMGMPGETVIATVYEPTELLVRVELPLNDVAKVEPGQRVEVTCDAVPGRKYDAEVVWLARWANIVRNSLPVRVRVLDADEQLRPEMLTRCRFLPIEREPEPSEGDKPRVTRLYVPSDALIRDGEQRAVVVFDPQGDRPGEGRARRVPVQVVGDESAVGDDGMVAVEGELSITHRVIVSAPGSLGDGARVRLMEDTP